MTKSIILFSGVHGVGKSYFIRENLKDKSDIVCVGASELLQNYRSSEDAGYKKVNDVAGNQELLLDALAHLEIPIGKVVFLDGHLCVINSRNEIEKIPETFILKAKIRGIVLLQEKISLISQRQKLRDGKCLPDEIINEIQCQEKAYAELLLKKYQIPFEVISSGGGSDKILKMIGEMRG